MLLGLSHDWLLTLVMSTITMAVGVLVFFFQAEDGIRDDLVTGVQTCALPITNKSREALLFEAQQTEALVGRDPDRIGEQDPERWRRIAAVYRQLGLLTDDTLPAALIWDGNDGSLCRWLIPPMLVPAALAIPP